MSELALDLFNACAEISRLRKRIEELESENARLEAHIAALEEAAEIEEWDDFPNFPEPPEVKE